MMNPNPKFKRKIKVNNNYYMELQAKQSYKKQQNSLIEKAHISLAHNENE